MRKSSSILLAATAVAAATALAPAAPAGAAPAAPAGAAPAARLIPRADLFGNPVKANARISPDGTHLAWIAPRDGVMNIFVAPIGDLAAAKPLTAETKRPIRSYFWSPDSRQILFINDAGGDENFKLYGVDVASGALRILTPFDKTRVQIVNVSNQVKDRILIGVNNRDPKWHDVHSLDLASGKLTPVLLNTGGFANFLVDEKLNVRAGAKSLPGGGGEIYRIVDGKTEATPFESFGLEDSMSTQPLGYTVDGTILYWLDSRGRDTAALIAQDVATGAKTVIAADPRADIGGVLANPITGKVEAFGVDYLTNEWTALDPAVKDDLAFLKAQIKGDFAVTSRTAANDRWTISADTVTASPATYLYDRKAKSLTKLFSTRPALDGQPLSAMHPREIKSRDGLILVSYLTLPPGSDANADGRPDTPVPLVLLVHGGPWGRDEYGYNPIHQLLANRGYAVLSTNFRASTGFGKKFTSAGDLQWGRKMHDDLLDAVDWAVANGVTTQDKVAIMGGSYGGYATLAGLAFTPERFACGVDIVGPSNLATLLGTIPPYWESIKAQFYQRMGDPNTEAGRAILKERSPLYAAASIKRPLLIGQGANDPRVNVAESEQIVAAMTSNNIPVTYVVFPDEGHGFARPQNNIAFMGIAENFLTQCLGGRAEPIGDTVKASTAKVEKGVDLVPGLAAAATR